MHADLRACMQVNELACTSFLCLSSSQEFCSACCSTQYARSTDSDNGLSSFLKHDEIGLLPNKKLVFLFFLSLSMTKSLKELNSESESITPLGEPEAVGSFVELEAVAFLGLGIQFFQLSISFLSGLSWTSLSLSQYF